MLKQELCPGVQWDYRKVLAHYGPSKSTCQTGTKDQIVSSLMEKSHTLYHLDVENLERSVQKE